MDGVKRYIATGVSQVLAGEFPAHERFVFASDFDAALAREAALREELERQTDIAHAAQVKCNKLEFRLAAAEQRNVAMVNGLLEIVERCKANWSVTAIELTAEEALEDAGIKLIESGASE